MIKTLTLFLITLTLGISSIPVLGKAPPPRPITEVEQPSIEKPARFPKHWGHPPRIQVRDHVKLPGKFGFGSSTVAKWIIDNLKKDGFAKPIIDPHPKPPVKPKPRPNRPEPSVEVKEKLRQVHEKQREMYDMRKNLRLSLREEPVEQLRDELIDNFRKASKGKLQSLKEAQQELQKEVRSKTQTGARRE